MNIIKMTSILLATASILNIGPTNLMSTSQSTRAEVVTIEKIDTGKLILPELVDEVLLIM